MLVLDNKMIQVTAQTSKLTTPLPSSYRKIFTARDRVTFEFDLFTSPENNNTIIGFILNRDIKNSACRIQDYFGVDFRNTSDGKIEPSFYRTEECSKKEAFRLSGIRTVRSSVNKIKLVKTGYSWSIYINGLFSQEFYLYEDIQFSSISNSPGLVKLDNFKATVSTVEFDQAQPTSEITVSDNPLWAICIGIEDYSQCPPCMKLGRLSFPVEDATEYYNFLKNYLGVPLSQLTLLTDNTEFKPTKENILQAITTAARNAKANDNIIIFLSGHGLDGNFCTSNGGLLYPEINEALTNKPIKKLLIADACHAGSWAESKTARSKGGDTLDSKEIFLKMLRRHGSTTSYVLACMPNEVSWECFDGNRNHSVFTYFFLQSLKDCEAARENPIILLGDVKKYVAEKVTQETRNGYYDGTNEGPQNPYIPEDCDLKYPISFCK